MTTRADEYAAVSRELLEKAREALEEDDLVQASEKLWGAAAQMVKSVAERRGWPHGGHRELFLVVSRVAQETGDRRFSAFFREANGLHWNFYEHWMDRYHVEQGLESIQELVEKLEAV